MNFKHSGLLNIPLELRQKIYKCLVSPASPNTSPIVDIKTYDGVLQFTMEPRVPHHLEILRVNKQMHAEALAIMYEAFTFRPIADERVLRQFFGGLSPQAREHVLRLELVPKRSAARRVPGPNPNISQIQLAPLWAPACRLLRSLCPALREVRIRLTPLNRYELGEGGDLRWIFVPLSQLGGVKKALCTEGIGDVVTAAELAGKWNEAVKQAEEEMDEYVAGMRRVREYLGSGRATGGGGCWPDMYWRKKRSLAKMKMASKVDLPSSRAPPVVGVDFRYGLAVVRRPIARATG